MVLLPTVPSFFPHLSPFSVLTGNIQKRMRDFSDTHTHTTPCPVWVTCVRGAHTDVSELQITFKTITRPRCQTSAYCYYYRAASGQLIFLHPLDNENPVFLFRIMRRVSRLHHSACRGYQRRFRRCRFAAAWQVPLAHPGRCRRCLYRSGP